MGPCSILSRIILRNIKGGALLALLLSIAIWLILVPSSKAGETNIRLPGVTTFDYVDVEDDIGNDIGDFGCSVYPGCVDALVSDSYDGGSATVGADPPFASSTASSSSDQLFVGATLTYSVEVIGPGQSVLLDFVSTTGSSVTGSVKDVSGRAAYATTIGQIVDANGDDLSFGDTCAGLFAADCYQLPTADNGKVTGAVLASISQPLTVTLSSRVYAPPGGLSSAYIDPYFFIDPSVPDPQDYRIVLAAGVFNIAPASPVPEMPSWTLLILGFAALCLGGVAGREARARQLRR
jgi:hypothetical protein